MEIVYPDEEDLTYDQAICRAYKEVACKVAVDSTKPKSFRKAMESTDRDMWLKAARKEMKAHEDNGTWTLVELPPGRHVVGSRWVFKVCKKGVRDAYT